jgi:hypothetical protein
MAPQSSIIPGSDGALCDRWRIDLFPSRRPCRVRGVDTSQRRPPPTPDRLGRSILAGLTVALRLTGFMRVVESKSRKQLDDASRGDDAKWRVKTQIAEEQVDGCRPVVPRQFCRNEDSLRCLIVRELLVRR